MVLNELIQRSPIRVFEQTIHGGLKLGEIGIIASPNGVGKTSVLVQLALDKLLQGKKLFTFLLPSTNSMCLCGTKIFLPSLSAKKILKTPMKLKTGLLKTAY